MPVVGLVNHRILNRLLQNEKHKQYEMRLAWEMDLFSKCSFTKQDSPSSCMGSAPISTGFNGGSTLYLGLRDVKTETYMSV